jgi:hypothetical protein
MRLNIQSLAAQLSLGLRFCLGNNTSIHFFLNLYAKLMYTTTVRAYE